MNAKMKVSLSALICCILVYFVFSMAVAYAPRGKYIPVKGGEAEVISQWVSLNEPISDLNLAWARIHLKWSDIELEPGEFNFSVPEYLDFKNAVALTAGMGVKVILTVKSAPEFYKHPLILGTSPSGTPTHVPSYCGRISTTGNPAGTDALKLFLVAVINQLRSDLGSSFPDPPIQYIEIWNEPDVKTYQSEPGFYGCWINSLATGVPTYEESYSGGEYYAQVLNTVAPYVKTYFPSIQFVAGSVMNADSVLLDAILDYGLENIDVVSFHEYVYGYNTSCNVTEKIQVYEDSFNHVRNDLDQRGATNIPILISEGAMRYWQPLVKTPGPDFYDCQADFAANLLAWAQGRAYSGNLLGFIWYTIGINEYLETDLLNTQGTPKPVYYIWRDLSLDPVAYLPLVFWKEGGELIESSSYPEAGGQSTDTPGDDTEAIAYPPPDDGLGDNYDSDEPAAPYPTPVP